MLAWKFMLACMIPSPSVPMRPTMKQMKKIFSIERIVLPSNTVATHPTDEYLSHCLPSTHLPYLPPTGIWTLSRSTTWLYGTQRKSTAVCATLPGSSTIARDSCVRMAMTLWLSHRYSDHNYYKFLYYSLSRLQHSLLFSQITIRHNSYYSLPSASDTIIIYKNIIGF